MEKTLALIKPDAVLKGKAKEIFRLIEQKGFTILRQKQLQLRAEDAGEFYKEHHSKPFYYKLIQFMTSGPIWALILAKQGAIGQWRAFMGPTNSIAAKENFPESVRGKFGTDGTYNAVHGSDSPESAFREIQFFFPKQSRTLLSLKEWEIDGYLKSSVNSIAAEVNPLLLEGLTELAKKKPASDSFEAARFLGQWLIENNPKQPTKITSLSATKRSQEDTKLNEETDLSGNSYFSDSEGKNTCDGPSNVQCQPALSADEAERKAATAVQAAYRGYKTRKDLKR